MREDIREEMNNNKQKYQGSCYDVAYSILENEQEAIECVKNTLDMAKKTIIPGRTERSASFLIRNTRHYAVEKMIKSYSDKNAIADKLHIIMAELKEVEYQSEELDNIEENVVALQLGHIMDKYMHEISALERLVFIRRYFYGASLEDIATLYKISLKKVSKLLKRCRRDLKEYLDKNKYVAKAETILRGLTEISDELLENGQLTTSAYSKKWIKPVAIVAALVLILGIGMALLFANEPKQSDRYELLHASDILEDGRVDVAKLIVYMDLNSIQVPVTFYSDDFFYSYVKQNPESRELLKYCLGDAVEDIHNVELGNSSSRLYKLRGHDDMQYIIEQVGFKYYLYEFAYLEDIDFKPVPYSTILSKIYNINSADDIESLMVEQAGEVLLLESDSTNIEYEKDVNYISNRDSIEYVYDVLSNMECYGAYNWDKIISVDSMPLEMPEGIYDLSLKTTTGDTTLALHFNTNYKCFYQDEDVAYSKLEDNVLDAIRNLRYSDVISNAVFPEWDVKLAANDVTPTTMTLSFKQSGKSLNSDLFLSNIYYIDKWNGSDWETIIADWNDDIGEGLIRLPVDEAYEWKIDWAHIYGELPMGRYRIMAIVECPISSVSLYNSFVYFEEFYIER